MENLKGLLRVLDEKIAGSEAGLEKEYLRLGEVLIALPSESVSGTGMAESYERARGLNESIARNLAHQERLAKLISQLEDLQDRILEKNKEIELLRAEVEPRYQEVGKRIVERSKESMEGMRSFSGRIEQLRALAADLEERDRELARTSTEPRAGFLRQALSEGKRVYLHGRLRARSMRADALYRQLGKEISERDELESLDSTAFADIIEPLLKYHDQRGQLEAQLAALSNRRSRVHADIQEIAGQEQPHRSLKRLEDERKALESDLATVLGEMARQFLDSSLNESISAKNLKAPVRAIQALAEEIAVLKEKRARVDAAIKIADLEGELEKKRARIQSLEATIRKANMEIETLNAKIETMGRERERLVAARGDEIQSAEDLDN